MGEDKYKFSNATIKAVMNASKQNFGHGISQMFSDFGDIEAAKETKKENKPKLELAEINLKNIKDTVKDKSNLMTLVKSGKSLEDSNIEFITPEYYSLAKDFADKNKSLMDIDSANYNIAQANTLFMKDGVFNESSFYSHMDKALKDKKINSKVYASVIDTVNKATERGIYTKKSTGIVTNDYKNYQLITDSMQKNGIKDIPSFGEYMKDDKISHSPSVEQKNYKAEMESKFGDKKDSWTPYHEWALNYRQAKKLTGENTYNNIINKTISTFSSKHNITDLSNFDFAKAIKDKTITVNEKNILARKLASTREAKTLESQFGKYNVGYKVIEKQAMRFANYARSSTVNTNIVQNATDVLKTYIPDLNPSKEDIENFEFRSDYLNLASVILKLQSGLTVTDKERIQFDKSMGTLSKNKKTNFVGIKQKLTDRKNALAGVKDVSPEYFNIKYGDRLRSLENSLSIIDSYLNNDTTKTENEESKIVIIKDKRSSSNNSNNVINSVEDFDKLLGN